MNRLDAAFDGCQPLLLFQMNDSMVESESHKKPSNGRNWADVNNSISSRMIAAASDSPPIIPKRYDFAQLTVQSGTFCY